MYEGLAAFDVLGSALASSNYVAGVNDRRALATASADLEQLYQGNQLPYVLAWIGAQCKDPDIKELYQKLATFHNIVRLITDRISTTGKVPIPVSWVDQDGVFNDEAARLWEEIQANWMGAATWDAFVPATSRRTDLLKTLVAVVEWDSEHDQIQLGSYGPHEIDVAYEEGNLNKLEPDKYYLVREAAEDLCDVWARDPKTGVISIHRSDRSSPALDPVHLQPIIDPRTRKPVMPFVSFRTVLQRDFFVWDGQLEMISQQEFVNRLYTRLSVLVEMGANKIPWIAGSGWVDVDGNIASIPIDISKVLKIPDDGMGDTGTGKRFGFEGPGVKDEIESVLKAAEVAIDSAASANRVNPSMIRAKNEAASGYSLQVEAAALRDRHSEMRTLVRPSLTRLAQLIRLYWDHFSPTKKRFPAGVRPVVTIPDYASGVTSRDEVTSDIELVQAKLKPSLPVILKHSPGISPSLAQEMADALVDALAAFPSGGVYKTPKAGAPAAGKGTPGAPGTAEAGLVGADVNVQATALNGAQVTALQAIVQSVADGQLPPASAVQMIANAFPAMGTAVAEAIVSPSINFKPTPPSKGADPSGGNPAAGGAGADPQGASGA